MRKGDVQLATPYVEYVNTKANIEALTGIGEGAVAYASDTNEFGSYDGSAWTWGQGGSGSADGWTLISASATSGTLDSPSFEISFNADMTATIGLGDRIKITQSTTKYFIVTKVGAYSGGATIITCYGGTDYALVASGTTAITNPYYSHDKAPFGFPLSPTKWTVSVTDTSNRSQASPSQNTWYNLGSVNMITPIGVWWVSYKVAAKGTDAVSVSAFVVSSTLSTANNSESNVEFTVKHQFNSANITITNITHQSRNLIALTSKTTLYLNTAAGSVTLDTIENNNASSALTIQAVCAYL